MNSFHPCSVCLTPFLRRALFIHFFISLCLFLLNFTFSNFTFSLSLYLSLSRSLFLALLCFCSARGSGLARAHSHAWFGWGRLLIGRCPCFLIASLASWVAPPGFSSIGWGIGTSDFCHHQDGKALVIRRLTKPEPGLRKRLSFFPLHNSAFQHQGRHPPPPQDPDLHGPHLYEHTSVDGVVQVAGGYDWCHCERCWQPPAQGGRQACGQLLTLWRLARKPYPLLEPCNAQLHTERSHCSHNVEEGQKMTPTALWWGRFLE